MKNTMRTKIASATVAAAATTAVLTGAGVASAGPVSGDSPDWPNYRVGPYSSQQQCENAPSPYIQVSPCFWLAPTNGWYFWGETI